MSFPAFGKCNISGLHQVRALLQLQNNEQRLFVVSETHYHINYNNMEDQVETMSTEDFFN